MGEPELVDFKLLHEAATCLKVMAHPVRLRIVDILSQGEFSVNEIAQYCELQPHQACEHLRLMQSHGLLDSERRGRAVYYGVASPRLPKLLQCIKVTCGYQR